MSFPVPSRKGGRQPQNLFVSTSGPDQPIAHDHLVHVDAATGRISKDAVIPSTTPLPQDLDADFADFVFGLEAMDDSQLADIGLHDGDDIPPAPGAHDGDESGEEGDMNEETEGNTRKRKFYKSSDEQMGEWKPWMSMFLEEGLRWHGLGAVALDAGCCSCGIPLQRDRIWVPSSAAAHLTPIPDGQDTVQELFRCGTCGDFLECERCCLKRHERSPIHSIRVWRAGSWERSSLCQLGLVFQLGHHGADCRSPDTTIRSMTVIHDNGIHSVRYRYCACVTGGGQHHWQQLLRCGWYPATTHTPQTCATVDVLNLYRRLKVMATVNVRDFVSVLEAMSDPYGVDRVPDRYKAFLRMSRQWAFLKRVRRSGILYEEGGLEDAPDGAIAVKCWACPRMGVNLPDGWDRVAAEHRYIYRQTISADANFKMTCKMRPSPYVDLPLYSGLGVQMPLEQYHAWLRSYITEEEVSSCIAFAALMQKDTRFSVGLRWAGVLGVICARHEILMGLGDLEKGERYKNTDFVLYWLLSRMGLKEVTITYDIACQYRKHFHERIEALPDCLKQLDLPDITWGLPVWHGNVHNIECETAESLKYQPGVGKTDGEGIERVWSVLNPMSYMTKEEQPGARHDDIEDKADQHNFTKNINLGQTLLRRLRIALAERAVQFESFAQVNATLEDDLRNDWERMVSEWLEDRARPNPYAPSGNVSITEEQVRLRLRQEEAEEERREDEDAEKPSEGESSEEFSESEEERTTRSKGAARSKRAGKKAAKKKPPPAEPARVSMAGFVILGLQVEYDQRRIQQDKSTKMTTDAQSKLIQRRRTLSQKLRQFRKWQSVYMPRITDVIEREETVRRGKESPPVQAEDEILYLPSACAASPLLQAQVHCRRKLMEYESDLRRAQCTDALGKIRGRLIAKRYLVNYRNAHVTGQRLTSRAATLIQSMSAKVDQAAVRYRASRARLVELVGEERCGSLKELQPGDVKVYITAESDAEAVKKLGRLEARDSRITATGRKGTRIELRRRDVAGEGRANMSWIWTADGGPEADKDEYIHECVRIEWARALARKTRWTEEVEILKEEMRRVLRSLKWEEQEWRQRSERGGSWLRVEELMGRRAYALQQAKDRARVRDSFEAMWRKAEPSRGRRAGPMDGLARQTASAIVDGMDSDV